MANSIKKQKYLINKPIINDRTANALEEFE